MKEPMNISPLLPGSECGGGVAYTWPIHNTTIIILKITICKTVPLAILFLLQNNLNN